MIKQALPLYHQKRQELVQYKYEVHAMAQAAADSSTQKATWRYWIMLALALVAGGSVLYVCSASCSRLQGCVADAQLTFVWRHLHFLLAVDAG